MAHLGWRGREEGGLLLGPRLDQAVTHFIADEAGCGTAGSFTLGAAWLNETLRSFLAIGMDCKGIIHSHPPGCTGLSGADVEYARRLMGNPRNGVDRLLMPLVVDHRLIPFVIFPSMPHVVHEAEVELF